MADRNIRGKEKTLFERPLAAIGLALLTWIAAASCGEVGAPTAPDRSSSTDRSTFAEKAGPAAVDTPSPDLAAQAIDDLVSPFEVRSALSLESDLPAFFKEVLTFIVPPVLTDPRHAEKLIKASKGGFVELNGFRVDIPRGALTEDTVVTIDLPTTLPDANFVFADFGPSGLTFQKPVRITMSLVGVNLTGIELDWIKIWFWDGTKWREPRGTATETSVTRTTKHFSKYGARGIDTTSGG
jgi:hypothetical protein